MKIKFYLRKFSIFNSLASIRRSGQFSSQKGFTLIELLIVIAILGILAAGILVAIDPIDKINATKDAQVQNDVSGIGRASEAYAVTHGSIYPAIGTFQDDLVAAGELKRVLVPPTGYAAYAFVEDGCSIRKNPCPDFVIRGELKSKKYKSTPEWMYQSFSGKSCASNGKQNCP